MQDYTSVLTLSEIKKRVIKSFASLTVRQIALRSISFITLNIVLAKVLPVETLGIFNIATSIVTFFAFFSDIGLAASLIQKKEQVTKEDIATVFTIQQSLVLILSLLIILLAPILARTYGLENDGVWLIRTLGIAFFLSSLKVVPSVMLERELKFQPLVLVEVIETLVFNLLLILLVFKGISIWSFSIATLARGCSGTLLLYILAPVQIRFGIYKKAALQLLSFGLPYQANSLLALLKDRLVPLVIAKMVGPIGIGYITWAQAIAFLPLEIMNMIIRITFPAFSRLQEDRESLIKAVEKSLYITSLMVYPALFGIGALLPSLVTYVVSSKWQPAVASFYFFAFSTYWAVISTTFVNILNAIGKIKTTLKLMVFWTLATWILTPFLVHLLGYIGVAISSFIISFSSVITIILVKRLLNVRVINSILIPTVCSFLMGVIVYLFAGYFVRDYLTLILVMLLGVVIYLLAVFIFDKERIILEIKKLRNA